MGTEPCVTHTHTGSANFSRIADPYNEVHEGGFWAREIGVRVRISGTRTMTGIEYDRSIVEPELAYAIVAGVDILLQECVAGEPAVTDVPRLVKLPNRSLAQAYRIWVDVANPFLIDEMLLTHPDIVDCRTSIKNHESPDTQQHYYYTTSRPATTTGTNVREYVLSALVPGAPVVCPARFIGTPHPALREGKVMTSRVSASKPDPVEILLGAACSANALGMLDARQSYVEGGGRLEHASAVNRLLTECGWHGLGPIDFARPTSLISLAVRLWRDEQAQLRRPR